MLTYPLGKLGLMGQNKCSTRTRTFFNGFITNLVVNNFWHDHPSLLSFGLVSFERSSSLKSIVTCVIDEMNQSHWATVTFVMIIILILSQSGLESSAASGSVKKITPPSAKKSKWNIELKSLKQNSKQNRFSYFRFRLTPRVKVLPDSSFESVKLWLAEEIFLLHCLACWY